MKISFELDYAGKKTKHGMALKDQYCKDAPREDVVEFLKNAVAALGRYLTNDKFAFGEFYAVDMPEEKADG